MRVSTDTSQLFHLALTAFAVQAKARISKDTIDGRVQTSPSFAGFREILAAVAQSLMTVLAKAPGESLGRIGPKEIAYEAFKTVDWPMSRGDVLDNPGDRFIPSRDSRQLREALVQYFEGKPFKFNPELAQEINRIADGAHLPRPAAAQIRVTGDLIEQQIQEQSRAQRQSSEIQLAQDVKRYTDLLNTGYQVEADRLALRMFEDHGPMLSQMAPSVWRDLTVSQDSTLQGASTLKRLRGLVQFEMIPGYTACTTPDGRYDHGRARTGFEEALGLRPAMNNQSLVELKDSIPGGNDPFKLDVSDGEATAPYRRALRSLKENGEAAQLIKNLLDGKELSGTEKAHWDVTTSRVASPSLDCVDKIWRFHHN
ncbi:MAG: hypothetical protein K8F91_07870 [Candidatus Obscuribacterales bacterium]|nr:hypothetical protein [Candidatus Obscuribacterales bacterium]